MVAAAARVGTTVSALRWLERRNVVVARRDARGRRVYTEAELVRIAAVLNARDALKGHDVARETKVAS